MKKLPFADYPVSELQKRLGLEHQKRYDHEIICSGDRRFPIGTPGKSCCCKIIKSKDELNMRYYALDDIK